MLSSDRFKHAFKTALAIVLSYAVALACNWSMPYWAAFTAATMSMATRGEGIHKGAMRVAGAIGGTLAGFALLAAFVQDRWAFITALSTFGAVCVYFGSGTRRYNYFWQQAGFFVAVVGLGSAFNPVNAFGIGVERAQESMAGLLVYTAVNLLLWPRDSGKDMEQTASKLLATLHQLFAYYTALLGSEDNGKSSTRLTLQATALETRFGVLLDAAAIDSWEVGEVLPAWRRWQVLTADFRGTVSLWQVGSADLKGLRIDAVLPALAPLLSEVEGRLAEIGRMVAGGAPERQPRPIALEVDKDELAPLSPFARAAVSVTRQRLEHIERTTRALFATVSEIRGLGPAVASTVAPRAHSRLLTPDLDRLAEAWRVIVSAWLVFLAVIYIPNIPGELGMVAIATRFVLLGAISPGATAGRILGPVFAGAVYAFPVYILIMPHLSTFSELALAVFAATFAIDYFFDQPRRSFRSLRLYMFLALIHVTDRQSYSFITFADSALRWLIVMALAYASEYVPVSRLPDRVFLSMMQRFLKSSAFLLPVGRGSHTELPSKHHLGGDEEPTQAYFLVRRGERRGDNDDGAKKVTRYHFELPWLLRLRTIFHRHELATLPQKLAAWGRLLPREALGSMTHGQVLELATSLGALGLRMEALIEAHRASRSDPIVDRLRADLLAWRRSAEKLFVDLAADPDSGDHADLGVQLDAMLARVEKRVEEVLDSGATPASGEDDEEMYRLLGAYRGISEALISFAGRSAVIDWERLREARF